MRVLVCGANGFIGRHVAQALAWHGHQVVHGVARLGPAQQAGREEYHIDFVHDVTEDAWLPRLAGIDAVVNAVGVLRDTRARPAQAVHAAAPAALFGACATAGVRRLIHISALGIEGNPTIYARTKRKAEDALLGLMEARALAGTLVRPSVVFGPGGASSALFLQLARLPLLVLPRVAGQTRIQPVHVLELAEAVAQLLAGEVAGVAATHAPGVLDAVGPQPLSLVDFIASLRRQLGHAPARVWLCPDGPTRLSARLGDWLPVTPWGSEALALLSHDNVGDAQSMAQLLGRAPTHHSQLLRCQGDGRELEVA
ncbi:NAD-dependent epimerase/dehydratase family protein [Corticibacter populi]|uniref:NAD-dependent epimerase/dehydratase family protein n=1 Tax=Corticibacter populi TaxID=1550736 RepID=A0A3M6R028_9BURK|nr:NAD-dependent epimerase/dehydratase family protein [Corticibacter populi]RMX08588.1 NAD-dependent epimerase/dehydratase family protein [Corticibacter populi]RZS35912.1 nucleoside-diphosphate-sugar epimerase [Corticibacter populi]